MQLLKSVSVSSLHQFSTSIPERVPKSSMSGLYASSLESRAVIMRSNRIGTVLSHSVTFRKSKMQASTPLGSQSAIGRTSMQEVGTHISVPLHISTKRSVGQDKSASKSLSIFTARQSRKTASITAGTRSRLRNGAKAIASRKHTRSLRHLNQNTQSHQCRMS